MIRKQRFYYENMFGVDQYSMKTLRAIHAKYTRDYLIFFKSLSKMYGPSPQKREIDDALSLIQKVRGIIESILQSKSIDRADAKSLYELTEQIEEKKQNMLEQASQVKALRDRLDKIQSEVGLSANDLNVTRQIVRRGVKQAVGQQREGAMDFLSRAAPGTLELGRKFARGSAAVLAGPFAPLLGAGYGAAKGVAGVAKGLRQKMRERQERKLGGRLRTYTPSEDVEGVSRARGAGTPLAGISGMVEQQVKRSMGIEPGTGKGRDVNKSLMDFWSKGAYRAKYTKELLSVLKSGLGKGSKVGGIKNSLLDAADDFMILGVSMLPLLGKIGKFAVLAIAIGWSTKQMVGLGKASIDYAKSKKIEKNATDAYAASVTQHMKLMKDVGINEYARMMKQSVDEAAKSLVEKERKLSRKRQMAQPFHKKVATRLNVELLGGRDPFEDVPEDIRTKQIIREGGGTAGGAARAIEEQTQKLAELVEAIKAAANRMDGGSTSVVVPPNVHDAGDALTTGHGNGLEMGD